MPFQEYNFVTHTHQGRSHSVICNAHKINELYPEANYYIYDGGLDVDTSNTLSYVDNTKLDGDTRKELSSLDNTTIIDWREKGDFEYEVGTIDALITRLELYMTKYKYIYRLLSDIFNYKFNYKDEYERTKLDFYMRQKPLTILDLTTRVDGNIFWLDDDAVIIDSVDSILEYEFDVGVTARSLYNERTNDIAPLNAGVLIFNSSSEKIKLFVRNWIDKIYERGVSKLREQNAIAQLITESNNEIFDEYYSTGTLKLGTETIRTRVFPCSQYNYSYIDDGINPDAHKILHFKGGAINEEYNKDLIRDIKNDRLADWYRGCK